MTLTTVPNSDVGSVDVVIPVYNAEKYILETLRSVAAQSSRQFRVSVVDDCSTDKSPQIIKEFCSVDSRFHYVRTDKNYGGPAGPRNVGIAIGNAQWIAFCDADDLWMPHKLQLQLEIAGSQGFDLLCGGIADFLDGAAIIPVSPPNEAVDVVPVSHRKLLLKNWIAMSTVLVKRDVIAAAGPFNEAKTHVAVEDFDMWLRLSGMGFRLARASYPLVHYRKLPTSISANKKMMIEKALNIIGDDYLRRGQQRLFDLIRPLHWLLYVGTSGWMRAVRRKL